MDANTVTLIVGLAGIGSTLIASSLGIYFTAKARSGALRAALYNNQLEILKQIIHKQERFRIFATMLASDDNTHKDEARNDIGKCFIDFSKIQEEGAALLPTKLWTEVRELNVYMLKIIESYDKGEAISNDGMVTLVAMMTKVVLLTRATVGIDELSKESVNLFSSKKRYDKLTDIKLNFFKNLHEKANK